MVDLKEFFDNINNYTDFNIKKYIYGATDKYEPSLLLSLNDEFIEYCSSELSLIDEITVKKDETEYIKELMDQLIIDRERDLDNVNKGDCEYYDEIDETSIVDYLLVRIYHYSESLFVSTDCQLRFDNLNIDDFGNLEDRIWKFRTCFRDIIFEMNKKAIIKGGSKDEPKVKNYKNEVWFKVGILIASGELEKLLFKYGSDTKVAKHLNIEKSRPYISDSKYNIKSNGSQNVERNTNIYNDYNKLIKIYNHCTENKIIMTDAFIEIHSKIELK